MGRSHHRAAHPLLAALRLARPGPPALCGHEPIHGLSAHARLVLHPAHGFRRLVRLRTRARRILAEHPHAPGGHRPLLPMGMLSLPAGQALRPQRRRHPTEHAGRQHTACLQPRVLRHEEENLRLGQPVLAGPAAIPEAGARGRRSRRAATPRQRHPCPRRPADHRRHRQPLPLLHPGATRSARTALHHAQPRRRARLRLPD